MRTAGRRRAPAADVVDVFVYVVVLNLAAQYLPSVISETFTFSRTWMQGQFRRLNDPKGDAQATMLRLNLPPAYMLIHRTWTGAIGVLSQLEATLPFRQLMIDSVPGFAE